VNIDEIRKVVNLDSFFHSREKLGEGVYNALRYLITTQLISGGERLDYKKLGTLLNVSRVPIREAIQRLEENGLLEVKTNLGTYVTTLSPQEIRDIFNLRLVLETQALNEGFNRIPRDILRKLKTVFNEEAKSKKHNPEYKTTDKIKNADDQLHNLIIVCAESRIISRAYTQIENYIQLLRNMNSREYISSKEHVDIIDAIIKGSLKDAGKLLEKHILSVRDKSLANIPSG
jgi:DNA-binding GntR family transcriptional regulator